MRYWKSFSPLCLLSHHLYVSASFLFLFVASFLCLSRPQNRQQPPLAPGFTDSHSVYPQKLACCHYHKSEFQKRASHWFLPGPVCHTQVTESHRISMAAVQVKEISQDSVGWFSLCAGCIPQSMTHSKKTSLNQWGLSNWQCNIVYFPQTLGSEYRHHIFFSISKYQLSHYLLNLFLRSNLRYYISLFLAIFWSHRVGVFYFF